VTGMLNMNSLQVHESLLIRDKATFAEVELDGAHVGRNVELMGLTVSATLSMTALRVDQTLGVSDATFAKVTLNDARIGGDLLMEATAVTGRFSMSGLRVDKLLSVEGAFTDVELASAHAGDLSLMGSTVTGELSMIGVQVDHNLFMGSASFAEVDLRATRIVGRIYLGNSKIAGRFACIGMEVAFHVFADARFDGPIDCHVARIKGNLDLTDGTFGGKVDFSGAEIGGELLLGSAHWSDDAALVLRGTNAGHIPDLTNGWPRKLDVDGFVYRSVGVPDEFEGWFRKLSHYAPQPYYQLAAIVKSQGNSVLATKIAYAGREHERSEATGTEWAWLTALKWLIGYGHYPQRAMLWAIALVVIGAIVLRVSGEGARNGMPFGLAYSFDMLLPIIHLRRKHDDVDLQSWARYYFYCQKIMGWILGFFLIAAVSGLTK
jgi:hypothetical protein